MIRTGLYETPPPHIADLPKQGMMILDRRHSRSCFSIMPSCTQPNNMYCTSTTGQFANTFSSDTPTESMVEKNDIRKVDETNTSKLDPQNKKRTRIKITPEQKAILDSWIRSHQRFPYPTQEEKNWLSQRTGLSLPTLNTWFTNKRRRDRPPTLMACSAPHAGQCYMYKGQPVYLSKCDINHIQRALSGMGIA